MAEEAVKRKDTRRSPGIAQSFISAIGQKNVFTTPEDDLTLVKKALGEITAEDCQKAFAEFWDTEDLSLVLTSREGFRQSGNSDQGDSSRGSRGHSTRPLEQDSREL